jgi:hypothetical protein
MYITEESDTVVISQGDRRLSVNATICEDTVAGTRGGWTISYRVPEHGGGVTFDDTRPLDVVHSSGRHGRFIAWRKVGRRRLGIGVGPAPTLHDPDTA